MPQAVDSNSTPVSKYQRARLEVRDIFNDATLMITAFQSMACLAVEQSEHQPEVADGIFLIHRLLMRELDSAVAAASEYAANLAIVPPGDFSRRMQLPIDPDLFGRIAEMVENAFDTGIGEDEGPAYITKTTEYYNELLDRLDGDTDLIEAASLLPWLELKISNELGKSPEPADTAVRTMRDRFIAEAHSEGRTPAEISQALNLKQDAVLRAINRLTEQSSDRQVQAG